MATTERSAITLVIDVHGLDADAEAVDALARVALFARRCGLDLRLEGASPGLHALIELCGLGEALLGV
jgi:hypothetical protein